MEVIAIILIITVLAVYFELKYNSKSDAEKHCEAHKAVGCGHANTNMCGYPDCIYRDQYVHFMKHGEHKLGDD